jgi:penicillin-binding protein 1B
MRSFGQPSGVVEVQLDKATNRLATPSCPETYTAAFVNGTEPRETCDQSSAVGGFFSHLIGLGGDKALPPPPAGTQAANGQAPAEGDKKKKGFFGKIVGIFKDDKSSSEPSKPPDSGGTDPH